MKINVSHVAKLANLPLTDEEKATFEPQLEEVLTFVETLNQVDTQNVKPTDHITGLENIERNDEIAPSLSQHEALINSKTVENGFFKVKGVLDNG